jgi:hypothetical protein
VQKIHVPAHKSADFSTHAVMGREPEDFDDETAPRYREYLSRKGVSKDDLANARRWNDLACRACEKDDCFDLPPEGSLARKRLIEDGKRMLEMARLTRANRDQQPATASATAGSAETPRADQAGSTDATSAKHPPAPEADRAS